MKVAKETKSGFDIYYTIWKIKQWKVKVEPQV